MAFGRRGAQFNPQYGSPRRGPANAARDARRGAAFSTIRWLIASGAATRNGAAVASLSVVAAIAMPALFAAIARLTSASAEFEGGDAADGVDAAGAEEKQVGAEAW